MHLLRSLRKSFMSTLAPGNIKSIVAADITCYAIHSAQHEHLNELTEDPVGASEEMNTLTYKSHRHYSLLG